MGSKLILKIKGREHGHMDRCCHNFVLYLVCRVGMGLTLHMGKFHDTPISVVDPVKSIWPPRSVWQHLKSILATSRYALLYCPQIWPHRHIDASHMNSHVACKINVAAPGSSTKTSFMNGKPNCL